MNSVTAKILVIDDVPENLHLLVTLLGEQGYQVQPTISGRLGLKVAQTSPPDLILLDIRMPDMDGYEVCQQLKANPQTAEVPVIFLSAMNAVEEKVKAFQMGGVDYVTKPFQPAEVRMRVQTQLAIRAAQQEIQSLNATLEERVQQRTAELEMTHQRLIYESTQRQQAQQQVLAVTQQLLQQRSDTIEQTYDAIHNGPLQELAVLLRSVHSGEWQQECLHRQLTKLNADLRGIYQSMREGARNQNELLHLDNGDSLDLNLPIVELLSDIFDRTMDRDFPGFAAIPIQVTPNFTPLAEASLTLSQKRGVGLFLQEALCNIGKHAKGTTQVQVACHRQDNDRGDDCYTLQISDNGSGLLTPPKELASASDYLQNSQGQGTYQANAIAQQLNGIFHRRPNSPHGTICELIWPHHQNDKSERLIPPNVEGIRRLSSLL